MFVLKTLKSLIPKYLLSPRDFTDVDPTGEYTVVIGVLVSRVVIGLHSICKCMNREMSLVCLVLTSFI